MKKILIICALFSSVSALKPDVKYMQKLLKEKSINCEKCNYSLQSLKEYNDVADERVKMLEIE